MFHAGREVDATKVKLFVHEGQVGASVNDEVAQVASLTLDLAYRP